jgi:hypothetical protein
MVSDFGDLDTGIGEFQPLIEGGLPPLPAKSPGASSPRARVPGNYPRGMAVWLPYSEVLPCPSARDWEEGPPPALGGAGGAR